MRHCGFLGALPLLALITTGAAAQEANLASDVLSHSRAFAFGDLTLRKMANGGGLFGVERVVCTGGWGDQCHAIVG